MPSEVPSKFREHQQLRIAHKPPVAVPKTALCTTTTYVLHATVQLNVYVASRAEPLIYSHMLHTGCRARKQAANCTAGPSGDELCSRPGCQAGCQ